MPRDREDDDDDRDEDYRRRAQRRRRDDDDDDEEFELRRPAAGGGIIPYRNGMALASYYCGVFSLIPCLWGTLSILAIVFGFIGLGKAKERPEAGGKGHCITGIVLGIITIVGPVIGLLILYVLR
jgi:Domain of unknown function (DUF4190)